MNRLNYRVVFFVCFVLFCLQYWSLLFNCTTFFQYVYFGIFHLCYFKLDIFLEAFLHCLACINKNLPHDAHKWICAKQAPVILLHMSSHNVQKPKVSLRLTPEFFFQDSYGFKPLQQSSEMIFPNCDVLCADLQHGRAGG